MMLIRSSCGAWQLPWSSAHSEEGRNERPWGAVWRGNDFCHFWKFSVCSGALKGITSWAPFLRGCVNPSELGLSSKMSRLSRQPPLLHTRHPHVFWPGGHSQTSDSSLLHFCPLFFFYWTCLITSGTSKGNRRKNLDWRSLKAACASWWWWGLLLAERTRAPPTNHQRLRKKKLNTEELWSNSLERKQSWAPVKHQ